MLLVFAHEIYDFIETFVNLIDKFLVPSRSLLSYKVCPQSLWKMFNGTNSFPYELITKEIFSTRNSHSHCWLLMHGHCIAFNSQLQIAQINDKKETREEKSNWLELRREINKFISSRYENKFSQHEIWWISIIDIFIVSSAAFSRWLLDNLNIELFFRKFW